MMLRGLWKLTWIEIKVFMREPHGGVRHHRCAGAALSLYWAASSAPNRHRPAFAVSGFSGGASSRF